MTISIVLATYNGEKYVKEQIQSLLDQEVQPNEIIICDDCSSDSTLDLITSIDYGLVKTAIIQHKKNLGVVQAFMDGIEKATGDIVLFCDQDDYWYSKKIKTFIDCFKKYNDVALLFCNSDISDSNLTKCGKTLWETISFHPCDKQYIKYEMLKRNVITGMSMGVRREWIGNCPSPSGYMLHDEFYGWCAALNGTAMCVDIPLSAYRQHGKNVVGSNKVTPFESISLMKSKVLNSSKRTLCKFIDVRKINKDNSFSKYIDDAIKFYRFRTEIFELRKDKALIMLLKNYFSGNYMRFTSKTERALIKDICCIFL